MLFKRLFLTAAIAALFTLVGRSQIVINELMQSNIDCLADDINEFPDSWVELYNAGTASVSLQQLKLGITPNSSEAWPLSKGTLGSGEYIVVYCDKTASGMHTHFRLDSGNGCAAYLFNGNQLIDSVVDLPKQPAPNVAYGRKNDNSSEWGYQAVPTPGYKNCGKTCSEILPEPLFSSEGSVFTTDNTFELTLYKPEGTPDEATIRYTLDGSEPTKESTPYNSPITIAKTTLVRATLFCDGYLSPRSATQSYIFHNRELTLPVVSIVSDSMWLYSKEKGIIADGEIEITPSGDYILPNYYYTWRRPINVEYFEAANQPSVINQLGETRLMGQSSRGNSLKSLVIYANKRFGKKNFKHEFFPEQKPGMKKFKSLILRNSGNDFSELYMRDAIVQRSMAAHKDIDWQAYQPTIVYINGNYYGILNLRERSNDHNIITNYDGLEDIDMVEYWRTVKMGSEAHWEEFKNFYSAEGHSIDEYEEFVDMQEFNNIMAMNLYFNNYDFPGNNCIWWRPAADGGKWRIIAKDCDFGMGLYGINYDFPIMEWFYNPGYALQNGLQLNAQGSNEWNFTIMFRNLMKNTAYRQQFLDLMAVYMGDFLNARGIREIWDPMYDAIKDELPYHQAVIPKWWEVSNYDASLEFARQWIDQRNDYFIGHMASFYKAGTPLPMTVNTNLEKEQLSDFVFTVNDIPLTRGVFDGKFYSKRTITVKGTSESAQVKGWQIVTTDASGNEKETETTGQAYTFTMPSEGQIAINAILGEHTGIAERSGDRKIVARYSLDGRLLQHAQQGINIVKYSDGTVVKVVE